MEKYYFTPGDTGFKAFATQSGTLGAAICWDQWYPETARAMALQGAEVLLYPTAIGTEPEAAGPMDTSRMWRRVMLGHAVANACYLGAANRIGREVVEGSEQTFYGTSFICDYAGEILAEAGRTDETVLVAPLNLAEARAFRAGMGFFRDRRPDLYGPLLTRDGKTRRDSALAAHEGAEARRVFTLNVGLNPSSPQVVTTRGWALASARLSPAPA